MRLLVTGGAGFIGSNFIRHMLSCHPDCEITNLDKLTYAGNLKNLVDIESDSRYRFIKGDITDQAQVNDVLADHYDAVINFAAESHVDRSISDASPFIETNVNGTRVLLDGIKKYNVERYIQVSTDEVYGTLGAEGKFDEQFPLLPNSPYAASKAAADLLCRAYYRTYGLPIIITRSSNNYGPYQFPEKFVPLAITNAWQDRPVPVYGDGLNVREWVYVLDHCRALDLAIQKGELGHIYNIGGGSEKTNLDLVHHLLKLMGKPETLITFVTDRPGHDQRYALDTTRITSELGWVPEVSFEEGLKKTVQWYADNESWWRKSKG